ncbi:EF-hand domain-containing protein [Plasmodiophora brassicae]|uniref:EF-hand domain-containing protein n=1 Tax=Plasmodiophora brassicae TaxID=37360 RepID=A8Y7Q5_PLABS|nr:hypothetical protein [Plasmodiophora brassicae]CAP58025.1 hypothetical protein [Plasmodiophora brassicae]CEO96035.1 hypothetical protein PBRA_004725 [Plasmodiophora brassicae]SPQ93419.1 unnamed protein product [Plasmodiophora brassicae]
MGGERDDDNREERAMVRCLRRTFDMLDRDGLHRLNRTQVKMAWQYLFGFRPATEDVDVMIGTGGNGVDLERFIQVTLPLLRRLPRHESAREVFAALDRAGKGFIDEADFVDAARSAAPLVSLADARAAFEYVAGSQQGRVGYKQLERIMNSEPIHRIL